LFSAAKNVARRLRRDHEMSKSLTVAAVLAAALIVGRGARLTLVAAGGIDVLTHHNDAARTGQNVNETILTPVNVNMTSFGRVGFFSVDGRVDAQPLFLSSVVIPGQGTHNVLYVATEHDSVYAFDGNSGAVLWRVSLGSTGEVPSDNRGCSQVTPDGHHVHAHDRSHTGPSGAIYVIAMSKDTSGHYFQRSTRSTSRPAQSSSGAEEYSGVFRGVPPALWRGDLRPEAVQERAALLLLNGSIVTSWSSHCDIDPYTGWIMAADGATLAQTSVLNVTPRVREAPRIRAGGGGRRRQFLSARR
jgi:hypothetical protein